jgi:CDP-diacylglycerol--glycerol-3-phosphate 3-phosphatidyltransferase
VAAGIAVGWINAFWINGVFAIIAVLLLCTLLNRVRQGLREVQQDGSSA